MSLYYRIWVDAIKRIKSLGKDKDNWQTKIILFMSAGMTFNFMLIMAILQKIVLDKFFYVINSPKLSELQNSFLTILLLFFLPCIIINYFLIFRGKRYEQLLEKYPYYNGKLFLIYYTISIFLPIILLGIKLYYQF